MTLSSNSGHDSMSRRQSIHLLVQTTKSSTVHEGNEPHQHLTTFIHLFIHSLTQTSDTGVVSEMYNTDTISRNLVTFILLMHSYIQIPPSPTHPSAPAPKIKFYDQICTSGNSVGWVRG